MLSKMQARQAILNLVVAHYPEGTWATLQTGASWAYQEAWASTRHDPRFASIPGQRRFRAGQERHFLMESSLAEMASRVGLPFVGEVMRSNQWVYGMVRTPGLCLMQKRVQNGGEPPPADFRRQIAAANSFVRQGELFVLGEAHTVREQPIHGILIHATESQRFADDGFGRPAFVRLAFPFGDYSGWIATFTLAELTAAYPAKDASNEQAPAKPALTWKVPDRRDDKENKDDTSGRG